MTEAAAQQPEKAKAPEPTKDDLQREAAQLYREIADAEADIKARTAKVSEKKKRVRSIVNKLTTLQLQAQNAPAQ